MMDFQDWVDYNWERLQEEYDDYKDECTVEDKILEDYDDWLSNEYEGYVSEFQDIAYENYRDSLLD